MPASNTLPELPGAGGILAAPWRIVQDDDAGIALTDASGQVVWAENFLNLVGELDYEDYVQCVAELRERAAALVAAVNNQAALVGAISNHISNAGVAQRREHLVSSQEVAGGNPAPRSIFDLLHDQRNELMNAFGHGPFEDGLVRDRIAEIDSQLGGGFAVNKRPGIAQRIDAVVAAVKITGMIKAEDSWPNLPGSDEPFMIVGALREPGISAALIRQWLDAILGMELTKRWRKCWVCFHVGEIETALGFDHDPRSAEAIAVYADKLVWQVYCFPPEPVTVEIPIGEGAHA